MFFNNVRQDSLSRLVDNLGGLGTENDSISSNRLSYRNLTWQELDYFYRTFWMVRKVVDYKPNMMAREWGGLSLGSLKTRADQLIDNVNAKLKKARSLYHMAQRMANKDGGAIILRLVDDGNDYDEPIDESNIRTFDYSRVYTRWEITPKIDINDDPLNPEYYFFNTTFGEQRLIHKSRVIRFRGNFVSFDDLKMNEGWETSKILPFLEPCLRYVQAYGYVGSAVKTFEVVIHSIEDLFTATETIEAESRLLRRMQLNQMQMSSLRGLIADKDREEISILSRSFSGVSDILEKLKDEMVAASGLTKPQLLSEHPTGLSATGESERLAEADDIRALQIYQWDDLITKDCELYLKSKECPTRGKIPKSWCWEWRSLFQMTPSEKAVLRQAYATLDATNISSNIYSGDEVRQSRYASNTFGEEIVVSGKLPEIKEESEIQTKEEPIKNDTDSTRRRA